MLSRLLTYCVVAVGGHTCSSCNLVANNVEKVCSAWRAGLRRVVGCLQLLMIFFCHKQGSHASWKILESPEIFSGKFPGPGKY